MGQACQEYHLLNVPTYGVYLRATDKGRFLEILRQYPEQDVRVRSGACQLGHVVCLLMQRFQPPCCQPASSLPAPSAHPQQFFATASTAAVNDSLGPLVIAGCGHH